MSSLVVMMMTCTSGELRLAWSLRTRNRHSTRLTRYLIANHRAIAGGANAYSMISKVKAERVQRANDIGFDEHRKRALVRT